MSYPTFISKGTKGFGTGSSVSFTYMSTNPGDMLFLYILSEGRGTYTVDGSWSLIANNDFGTDSSYRLYYKTATGSESGTEAVSRSGHTAVTLFMAQVYDYRQSSLGCVFESAANDADTTDAIDWGAVTVGGSSRTLLAFVINVNSAAPDLATGYTNVASDNSSGSYMVLDNLVNVSAGTATSSTSGSADGWATSHVSIYGLTQGTRSFIVN